MVSVIQWLPINEAKCLVGLCLANEVWYMEKKAFTWSSLCIILEAKGGSTQMRPGVWKEKLCLIWPTKGDVLPDKVWYLGEEALAIGLVTGNIVTLLETSKPKFDEAWVNIVGERFYSMKNNNNKFFFFQNIDITWPEIRTWDNTIMKFFIPFGY